MSVQNWCVIAYYYAGGLEILGPYTTPEEAAEARKEVQQEDWCDNALKLPMMRREAK